MGAIITLLAFYAVLFLLPFLGVIGPLTVRPNRYRPVKEPNDSDELAKKKESAANNLEYPPDPFGFFTDLQPGRVKLVEARDGRFIRALMDYPEHIFAGEQKDNDLNPGNRAFWQVSETGAEHKPDGTTRTKAAREGDRSTHPIPFPIRKNKKMTWLRLIPPYVIFSLLWWVWKRWIYWLTGAVWVGVYPFRQIRIYPMPRERLVRLDKPDEHGRSWETKSINDYSDHYRVQDFQFPVLVPHANCQDNIPVNMIVNYIGRVRNPWSLAYDTDDQWPTRLFGSVSDAVTGFARSHPISEVLTTRGQGVQIPQGQGAQTASGTSSREVDPGDLPIHIARIGFLANQKEFEIGSIKKLIDPPMGTFTSDGGATAFGIITAPGTLPQIPDVSPANDEDAEQLSAPAFAAARRDADVLLAVGQAARTREQGRAIRDFPEGAVIPQIEGNVRTAEAVQKNPNAIVVVGATTPTTDPTQLAILAELRRLNGSRNGSQGGGTSP